MHNDTPPEFDQLVKAIENNELVLPSMPEWAVKIQKLLDDADASSSQIVNVISGDPAFAAQLIRMANSAVYADKPKVDTVNGALSRLGHKLLRTLVMKITMTRLANANHPVLRKRLAEFTENSRNVAAISYVLAWQRKYLNPDQAMLAGMVHNIGILPICMHMDKNISRADEQGCDLIVNRFRGKIGEMLLKAWSFPDELVAVPVALENLQRETGAKQSDYADVVTVANLLSQPSSGAVAWDSVFALQRLAMSPEECAQFHERFGNQVRTTRELLSGD